MVEQLGFAAGRPRPTIDRLRLGSPAVARQDLPLEVGPDRPPAKQRAAGALQHRLRRHHGDVAERLAIRGLSGKGRHGRPSLAKTAAG